MCVCVGGVLGGCSRGLPCPLAAPSRPRTPRMAAAAVCSRACERRSPFLSSSSSSSPPAPLSAQLSVTWRPHVSAAPFLSAPRAPPRCRAMCGRLRVHVGLQQRCAERRGGGGAGRCGGTPQYVWVCGGESPVRGTGVCVCCCKRGRVGAGTYVCVCVGVCGCVHAAGLHPPTLQGCVCEPCACMCSVCVCVRTVELQSLPAEVCMCEQMCALCVQACTRLHMCVCAYVCVHGCVCVCAEQAAVSLWGDVCAGVSKSVSICAVCTCLYTCVRVQAAGLQLLTAGLCVCMCVSTG